VRRPLSEGKKSRLTFQRLDLVGGFNPSEKYKFVSWDDENPNRWNVIKFMFEILNHQPDKK
jgi:hypothetical protein